MFNISFNTNPKLEVPREKTEHLLTLKVMRLMRPSLVNSIIVTTDDKDLPGSILNNYLKNEITSVPGSETISSGQFLLLPQCFGSIYLGETFSSYICVHNDSAQIAKDVTVKAILQNQSFEIMLSKDPNQSTDLEPGNTINEVLHHEVKEFGPHVLICEISYCCGSLSSEPFTFRKFFKFDVLKPLDVKTKMYTAESDEVYLEAQIQNIISGPLTLEHVSLEASQYFKATQLDPIGQEDDINADIIKFNCSRQFLYRLTPISKNFRQSQTSCIGKLDIVWKTNMGERGRLQTSPLHRVESTIGDLSIFIVELPDVVESGSEFSLISKLTNNTEAVMDLAVELKSPTDYQWLSESRHLALLDPAESVNVSLKLSPTSPGLLSISGMTFIDQSTKKHFEWDEVAQVYVLPP